MDYNESRLQHYYVRWVLDKETPPRHVVTTVPLNHESFQDLINRSRDIENPITIISVVSILKYPYDHNNICDRTQMIKK